MGPSRIEFDQAATLTVSHEVVGPSRQRRAIKFFPPQGGTVTLSNDQAVVLGNGLTLGQANAPVLLSVEEDGDCVNRGWFAIYSAGAGPISFIQTLS